MVSGSELRSAVCRSAQYKGGPPRSLEELKGRYYGVARALMVGRAGGEELIANEPLVKAPFDVAHEQSASAIYCMLCCASGACELCSPPGRGTVLQLVARGSACFFVPSNVGPNTSTRCRI